MEIFERISIFVLCFTAPLFFIAPMTAPSACVPDLGVLSEKEEEILKDDRCAKVISSNQNRYLYRLRCFDSLRYLCMFATCLHIILNKLVYILYIYISMYLWLQQQTQRCCIAKGGVLGSIVF